MKAERSVTMVVAIAALLVSSPQMFAEMDPAHDDPGISPQRQQEQPAGALGHGLEIQEKNGISFVSGGVGDEQQDMLDSLGGRFNLKLTLARQDGKYMGSSTVRIDKAGGATVLETQTKGPVFLAKMPAGTYSIHASADGQSYTRTVTVPSSGQEEIVLTWPSERKGAAGDAPISDALDRLSQ